MTPLRIVAIVLIVAGGLAIAYGGFSYTKETHDVKLGPIELSVKEKQDVNVLQWAGDRRDRAGRGAAGGGRQEVARLTPGCRVTRPGCAPCGSRRTRSRSRRGGNAPSRGGGVLRVDDGAQQLEPCSSPARSESAFRISRRSRATTSFGVAAGTNGAPPHRRLEGLSRPPRRRSARRGTHAMCFGAETASARSLPASATPRRGLERVDELMCARRPAMRSVNCRRSALVRHAGCESVPVFILNSSLARWPEPPTAAEP